ncbi:hypothetical protein TWF192_000293 [Orbilia oligospora]|uniref:Uncharacterized protein n=1 Tax=Orbilia oligospora TaxID=2813651 RepID=A0A6G1MPB9_ORBOL|nr:hypothetical protein TWF679_002096 [Orbilia oligospora]KAF3201388.1 hypothetical protein TWF191_003422 [Orbilia oligospora]KAF3265649.1 hypothetical protein TWF192_000293 [Orbilia oligospora]
MKFSIASATLVGAYVLGIAAQPTGPDAINARDHVAQRPGPPPPSTCKAYTTQTGCPAISDPCCSFTCTSAEGITSCVESYAFEEGSGMVCKACPAAGLDSLAPRDHVAQRPGPPPPSKCKSYMSQTGCPAVFDSCCSFKCTSPEGITTCVESYAFDESSGMVCSACPSAGFGSIVRRETVAPTATGASAPVQTSSSSAAAAEVPSSSAPTKAGGASSSAPAAASTGNLSTSAPTAPKETKDRESGAAAGIYMMSFGTALGLGLLCAGLVL